MVQSILVGIVFVVALFYVGKMIYVKVTAGKDEAHCDKCLPKEKTKSQ